MTSCFEYRRLFPIPENSTTPVKKGRPKELKFDIPEVAYCKRQAGM